MRALTTCILALAIPFSWAGDDCTFDADDADSPGFANKLAKCQTMREQASEDAVAPVRNDERATRLYGMGTVDPASGISERPIVAAGSLNHNPGSVYAAREGYSLRPNAQFEDSVTFAIHKLHVQMAHYCAQGWTVEKEWSEPNTLLEGDFYLHYRFRCAEKKPSVAE